MDDYFEMQELSYREHAKYMRWVHDEQGTVEVVGVVDDQQQS